MFHSAICPSDGWQLSQIWAQALPFHSLHEKQNAARCRLKIRVMDFQKSKSYSGNAIAGVTHSFMTSRNTFLAGSDRDHCNPCYSYRGAHVGIRLTGSFAALAEEQYGRFRVFHYVMAPSIAFSVLKCGKIPFYVKAVDPYGRRPSSTVDPVFVCIRIPF